MRTPVIIPAFNEAEEIGRTLRHMPRDVEPIVVVNGSTDNTAEIAKSFGVRVWELEEQGKLPAIQYVLKKMGKQALDPLLLLDADAYPLFPHRWHRSMIASLQETKPASSVGLAWMRQENLASTVIRSMRRVQLTAVSRYRADMHRAAFGPNMALRINDSSVLDQVLAMPHIWPGEDRAISELIVEEDGGFHQLMTPFSYVSTRQSASVMPLSERLKMGRTAAHERVIDEYVRRAAATVEVNYDGESPQALPLQDS